jgi:hypothetical protein
MPPTGVAPARSFEHQLLRLARLLFRHSGYAIGRIRTATPFGLRLSNAEVYHSITIA